MSLLQIAPTIGRSPQPPPAEAQPPKLQLRPWLPCNAPALAQMANNRSIWNQVRDQLPHPYSLMDARQHIAEALTHHPARQMALWLGTELVGSMDAVPRHDVYHRNVEVGYFIAEPYWNQGLASAGLALLTQHIRQHMPAAARLYAEVFASNVASIRVLQKNGFRLEAILHDHVVKNQQVMDAHIYTRPL